jgi:hypothetical protein
MPGFPTETAPTTKAIGFVKSGVPLGDSLSTEAFIVSRVAFELVPMIVVPTGKCSFTGFLITLRRVWEEFTDLTLSLVRHCAIRAANFLYVLGTLSCGLTSMRELALVLM